MVNSEQCVRLLSDIKMTGRKKGADKDEMGDR